MTPEIILGPPGTGKTTAMLAVVEEELARGTAPDRIGFVTFTRRAAEEAVTRGCDRFKLEKRQFPHFSTLHAMCFRQLGMRRGDVLEGRKMQEFGQYAGVRVTGKGWSEEGSLLGFDMGDRILHMDNLARVREMPLRQAYDADDDGLPWSIVERVSKALAQYKRERGLADFTDMLAEFVRSDVRLGLEVLIVDEAQDLSRLQWSVVRQLARGCRRVAVAGDDDQAIYCWSGADVATLIEMEGAVRVLGQSWRVPPVVQRAADAIISPVARRRVKEWRARDGEQGVVARALRLHHADLTGQWTDETTQPILILARNTYVLRDQVEPWLREAGIIYERHGRSSLDPKLLSVVSNWEKLRGGGEILLEEAREIYDYMSSGVGVKRGHKKLPDLDDCPVVTMPILKRAGGLLTDDIWHRALDRLDKQEADYAIRARERGEKLRQRPRVRVSTIHGSKGGEADHVVLMREMAHRTHGEMERHPDDERRVWYVAATRAKRQLTVVESSTRRDCPWV